MPRALRITALSHSLHITPVTKEDEKSRANGSVMPPHSSGQVVHVELRLPCSPFATPLPPSRPAHFLATRWPFWHKTSSISCTNCSSSPWDQLLLSATSTDCGVLHRTRGSSPAVTQRNLRRPSAPNAQRSHSERAALCFQHQVVLHAQTVLFFSSLVCSLQLFTSFTSTHRAGCCAVTAMSQRSCGRTALTRWASGSAASAPSSDYFFRCKHSLFIFLTEIHIANTPPTPPRAAMSDGVERLQKRSPKEGSDRTSCCAGAHQNPPDLTGISHTHAATQKVLFCFLAMSTDKSSAALFRGCC